MKEDGTPDKRVGTGQFAQGKVDPHEAGKAGGQTSGTGVNDDYEGSSSGNSGGSGKGGMCFFSLKQWHCVILTGDVEFAHGKVDPHEAGKKVDQIRLVVLG